MECERKKARGLDKVRVESEMIRNKETGRDR